MSLGGGETQSPVAGSNKYAEIMELMRRRNAMNNSASIQPARSLYFSWGKSVQVSVATSKRSTLEWLAED